MVEGKRKKKGKEKRYLVYKNKKYRIHSSASNLEIYKNLIKIIRQLLPRKRKGKASKPKVPFAHPEITGGSYHLTRAALDQIKENRLQLLKDESNTNTEVQQLKNKVGELDNWVVQMEKFIQQQYEAQLQQQQQLINYQQEKEDNDAAASESSAGLEEEEEEEKVPKKKKRRPYKGVREVRPILNEIPLPPRRAKEVAKSSMKTNSGAGAPATAGLYNFEVNRLMSRFKSKGFVGVYSIDQLDQIEPANKNKISFILNIVPHTVKYGHFVAVMIDKTTDTLEYFNPFAYRPPPEFIKNIRVVLDKMGMPAGVQLKVNLVRLQRINSNNCGPFSISFLLKRYGGETWKSASGFDKFISILKEEKKMRAFMAHIKNFHTI
jgi:hypothetical protein